MSDKPWKAFERWWAKKIGGKRYPANSGGPIDVYSAVWGVQCKNVKNMSLNTICDLARSVAVDAKLMKNQQGEIEPRLGIVGMRNRLGSGVPSTDVVIMHISVFDELFPTGGKDGRT